ncbi:hypothetical protein F9B85_04565 [Heliorestis acidaminivorans]|uniref:Uncharacterized protein n=1 Tax=Heliorestis acidaminivorans TaxID=553427 RepID=A0A6I0F5D7_9FIRM|nr:hypothetical protein [Heliorestis acidaminivorans]KAB2953887.1 hypothetical protein F9B85_04565 [Heliorestis acidaminivorans]
MSDPLTSFLQKSDQELSDEIKSLSKKLNLIEQEKNHLEAQETSMLQNLIEKLLPILDKVYAGGIKFPIADTGHCYPEIVLFYDERKKVFYTLTKNGEIMERDFITPSDVNLMPTWVFVSHCPLEIVTQNMVSAIEQYRSFVIDAEQKHQRRKEFLLNHPQLKIPTM